MPYITSPSLDPQFRVYFSKEWSDTLILSFRNFLSGIFNGLHILEQHVICFILLFFLKLVVNMFAFYNMQELPKWDTT